MEKGKLVIVGTGILTPAHLSLASKEAIKSADIVHALVPDPLGLPFLEGLNSNIKNLAELYYDKRTGKNGNNRLEAYDLMVEAILSDVRDGGRVCAVFYGHPGVFVYPSHKAITIAKEEGVEATMQPAISAEDCLYSDLQFDPSRTGCQSLEASQFLFYDHPINPYSGLILWQISVLGDVTMTRLSPTDNGLLMLQDKLQRTYATDHQIVIYEATTLPLIQPRVELVELKDLCGVNINPITTIFVYPKENPTVDTAFCRKWDIQLIE